MDIKNVARNLRGPLLILGVVILANLLYVTGIFTGNPLDRYSGTITYTHIGILSGESTIDPNNAYTTQALGHAAVRDILHGKLPWWNYNEQVGAPLAGEMQSASLFLPFNLVLGLTNGVVLYHIVLELVAGIATYYLLRKLRCSELSAIIGGVLFAANGTFAWITNAAFNPIAFLPLMILAVELIFEAYRSTQKRGWILLAIGLALSLYAGFPETAFLDALLVGVWSLVRAYQLRVNKNWIRFGLKVGLGLIVGLLLAAPILIAFKDYYPYADVGVHTGALKTYSLPYATFPAFLLPYVFGPIFAFVSFDHTGSLASFWGNVGGYITFSLLILAIIGVFADKRRRALNITLAAWSLLAVARIYGFPGIAKVLNFIPGLSVVAVYRYIPPSMELAIIILAMFGLDRIVHQQKLRLNKRYLAALLGSVAVLFGVIVLLARQESHRLYLAPHHRVWFATACGWGLGIIVSIAISLFAPKKSSKFLIPLIVVVDSLIMFIVPQLSAPRQAIVDVKPITYLQQHIGDYRFYSLGPIMPNYGSFYNIAAINTNNLPIAKAWARYITKSLNPNADPISGFTGVDRVDPQGISPQQAFLTNMPAYEEIGVKYVIVVRGALTSADISSRQLTLSFQDPFFQIYQLPTPKPYFEASPYCSLHVRNKAEVTVSCNQPGTLLRRELYMPGWEARINGKVPIKITKAGQLFEKVELSKGTSTITFSFTPHHEKAAVTAMIAGVIIIAGSLVVGRIYLLKRLK